MVAQNMVAAAGKAVPNGPYILMLLPGMAEIPKAYNKIGLSLPGGLEEGLQPLRRVMHDLPVQVGDDSKAYS